jgi:hypothetical protein
VQGFPETGGEVVMGLSLSFFEKKRRTHGLSSSGIFDRLRKSRQTTINVATLCCYGRPSTTAPNIVSVVLVFERTSHVPASHLF